MIGVLIAELVNDSVIVIKTVEASGAKLAVASVCEALLLGCVTGVKVDDITVEINAELCVVSIVEELIGTFMDPSVVLDSFNICEKVEESIPTVTLYSVVKGVEDEDGTVVISSCICIVVAEVCIGISVEADEGNVTSPCSAAVVIKST